MSIRKKLFAEREAKSKHPYHKTRKKWLRKHVKKKKLIKTEYLPTELLLKLSDKPGMNLAESFSKSIWDMDYNSLTAPRHINLTATVKILKKEHFISHAITD